MDRSKEIRKLKTVFKATLKLLALYKRNGLTLPFTLKGNLGEIIVAIELLKRFPNHKINYRGGAFPHIDIAINDNLKIQVKTHVKQAPERFRAGEWDSERSPTIKRKIIEDKKCDLIILVILYTNTAFSVLEKSNVYIFNQKDFKYFSHIFCWSGRSERDYTIVNVLRVQGNAPPKLAKKIKFYNMPVYRNLFKASHNNWQKVKRLI